MPNDKWYDAKVVYLTDLLDRAVQPPLLTGFTFVGCQVLGPAVVTLLDAGTLQGCRFDVRNIEEMLFEVPEGATKTGIVGLANCTFENCEIRAVGIAGTPDSLAKVRQGLG